MATDQPQPDRCGAKVVDKLGAEIALGAESTSEADTVLTDESVRICRFVDDPTEPVAVVETNATYGDCQQFLWDDYVLSAVGLDPGVTFGVTDQEPGPVPTRDELEACEAIVEVDGPRPADDADLPGQTTYQAVGLEDALSPAEPDESLTPTDLVWVHTDPSVAHNVTNRYNELQGYCANFPDAGEQYCEYHAGRQTGNPYGYTEAEAKANVTHGLYARRTNYYKALEEEDRAFVEGMVRSWLEDAPFDRNNSAKVNELYRIAIDQHRAWRSLDEYVGEDGTLEGMTKEVTVDYDPETKEEVTAEDEHPINLAYSRLDRDIVKRLKEMEIYGSDDSTAEEAVESIATLLSGGE